MSAPATPQRSRKAPGGATTGRRKPPPQPSEAQIEAALLEALTSSDERLSLQALQIVLSGHLMRADPNVVAQIAARLQAITTRLAELGPPVDSAKSGTDEVKRAREARRAKADMAETPAGRRIQRRRGSA